MNTPVQLLIYGKIIIDTVRLSDGQVHVNLLGGGGPQAAFGARLWNDSVGLLTRSGSDIDSRFVEMLAGLDVDLSGWARYPDLRTVQGGLLTYDADEFDVGALERGSKLLLDDNWHALLARPLTLPAHYEQARAVHLITEHFSEPMVQTALTLQARGATFSLEPIVDFRQWKNWDALRELLPQVDLVTPDWPTASGIAQSDDPQTVLAYWSRLGTSVVAIRHGRHGSYVWDRFSAEMWHIPIAPIVAIDPTGAGNSYGAGLCAGWIATHSSVIAGCYGTVSASFVVETAGMPDKITPQMMSTANERVTFLRQAATRL